MTQEPEAELGPDQLAELWGLGKSGPDEATPTDGEQAAETQSLPPSNGVPSEDESPVAGPGSDIDGFRILEEVGRGGMGVVYKAYERSLKRIVALKVIRPDLLTDASFARRLRREAVLAANLSHPNIVPIFQVDPSPTPRYFTMEFVQGESLQERVQKDGFLSPAEATRIARQVAEALQYAHERNIIHRDIKPGNVLLQNHVERVRVTDFGIAQDVTGQLSEITQTQDVVVGTPAYMSPEQNLGHKLDQRTDIFSLGMTFYYALTGRPAYGARTRTELTLAFERQVPQPPSEFNSDVPGALDRIVMKMIAVDRDKRHASARDLLNDLSRSDVASGDTRPAQQVPARRSRPLSRRPWFIAACVASAVICGWIVWALWPVAKPPEEGAREDGVVAGQPKTSALSAPSEPPKDLTPDDSQKAGIRDDGVHASGPDTSRGLDQPPPRPAPSRNLSLLRCPADAKTAIAAQRAAAASLGVPVKASVRIAGNVALDLILIPPGEFNYGSDTTEVGRDTMFEIKRRRETVKSAFFMGRYEVTQEQWRAAFGEDAPASGEGKRTPRQPVSFVTFVHASDFLTLLNRKTGVQFRLPTEVEWEYACRAGTDGPYYCDLASMLPKYEWFNTKGMQPLTTKGVEPKEVGQLRPNPWGLYDMLGNVNEWCGGVPEGHFRGHGGRPVRGGSIIEKDIRCKATSRHPTSPDSTGWTGASNAILGFRVALDVEEYRKLVRDSAPRTVPKE